MLAMLRFIAKRPHRAAAVRAFLAACTVLSCLGLVPMGAAGQSIDTQVMAPVPRTQARQRPSTAQAVPANDSFSAAQVVAIPGTVNGTTTGATVELGEPAPSCWPSSTGSVWFRFTPAYSGTLRVDPALSFNGFLTLYTGTSLPALSEQACSTHFLLAPSASLTTTVRAGTSYALRLASLPGESGTYALAMSLDASAGRSFSLRPMGSQALLSWAGGPPATGYIIARLADGQFTLLPSGAVLPGTATSYLDTAPPAGLTCYALVALSSGEVMGNSDPLCWLPRTQSPGGGQAGFTIQIRESRLVDFSWTGPCGSACVLLRFGSSPLLLPATTTGTSAFITAPTCFTLLSTTGPSALGNTDIVCAVPGVARQVDSAGPAAELREASARLQTAARGVTQQLAQRTRRN
jgi:hypothetical protein